MSLGFLRNEQVNPLPRTHAAAPRTSSTLDVQDDAKPKSTLSSFDITFRTIKGPGMSLIYALLSSIPFFMFFVDKTSVAYSLFLLPFLFFTANCQSCWYAMTVAAYTGTSVLLLTRLYDESLSAIVFTSVVGAHLLPFYLVSWPRCLTFLCIVGACVQTSAWLVLGESAGVEVTYVMLPVFASVSLQSLIWLDMHYLKKNACYGNMLVRVLTMSEFAHVDKFDF